MKQLSNDRIQEIVKREIDAAGEYSVKRLKRRKESWDRYYGRKLGNEVAGRSKFITRDTMDTIEWMMPFFIRTFASGDQKLVMKIKGQPAWVGQALLDEIDESLSDNSPSSFLLKYQWIKDALVTDTAFVREQWIRDVEKVPVEMTVSIENLRKLANDPDVEIVDVEQIDGFGPPQFKVDAKVEKTLEDRPMADNIPYWEFLASPDSRDVNDEHPKGLKTKVTIDYLKRTNRANGGKFFKGLDEIAEEISEEQPVGYTTPESEGKAHEGYDETPVDNDKFHGSSIKVVELTEWFTRIDVNQDGYLEDVVCWMVSGEKIAEPKLIRWEINDEGFVSYSALKPIIDCYKLYGISWADLVIEIQNLHTMLIRRILDNFDFQNSGRFVVDPDSNIDMKTLLENAPGTAIIGKLDGIKEITPKGFMSGTFSILDYVKQLRENRTGIRDVNQGMPDPVNQTAQGMQLIYSTAMQRLELIARIFAETGFVDFYKKMGMLYQKYMRRPFITTRYGDQKQVTPEMIQGKIIMSVNMGVAANIGMQEAQKVANIMGFLGGLNQQFPGLLNPERIHSISRKYITSMGFKDVDEFIGDVKGYVEEYTQQMQAAQQEKQQMMALQKRLEDMEMMLKDKEITTRATVEGQRIKSEDVSDQRKFITNQARIEAQREKSNTDAAVEIKTKAMEVEMGNQKNAVTVISEKIKALMEAQKILAEKNKPAQESR